MARQPPAGNNFAGMVTPVTPIWPAGPDRRAAQRTSQRLLPSAIEMTTPPDTILRHHDQKNRKRSASVLGHEAAPLPEKMRTGGPPPIVVDQSYDEYPIHAPVVPELPINPAMQTQVPGPMNAVNATPVSANSMNTSSQMLVKPELDGYPMMYPNAGMLGGTPDRMHPGNAHYMPQYAQVSPLSGPSDLVDIGASPVPHMPHMGVDPVMYGQYNHYSMPVPDQYRVSPPDMTPSLTHTNPQSRSQPPLPGWGAQPPYSGYPQPALRRRSGNYVSHPEFPQVPQGMPAMPTFHASTPVFAQAKRTKISNPQSIAPAAAKSRSSTNGNPYEEYNHYIMRHAADVKSNVIWHPEVEVVFMEALWLIPGEPTKVVMSQRARGRNELISDYMMSRLGESRSRKQVSSHLQVLKKLLQSDDVFMNLVGPRRDATDIEDPMQVKSKPVLEARTIEELVSKLREIKKNEPKPRFLLQAEANCEHARNAVTGGGAPKDTNQMVEVPKIQTGSAVQISAAFMPNSTAKPKQELRFQRDDGTTDTESLTSSSPDMPASVAEYSRAKEQGSSLPTPVSATNRRASFIPVDVVTKDKGVDGDYPPLLQPRPLPSDHKVEPLIVPSASVPPVEPMAMAMHASPRRNRHRRTTSASVELSGDKVLPIQFCMMRRVGNSERIYTRLLRAAYESPIRPVKLASLLPEFNDLRTLSDESKLKGVPIIHANVSIFIGDAKQGSYSSDVQYMLSGAAVNAGYRYYAKTIITSRKELLRCQFPCPFQQISGRGLEEDKDIVNVPFLPDFWDDFLHRLEVSGKDYARASLSALKMFQAIYRVGGGKEELAFVALSRFSVAEDEFSARTRFRRVKSTSAPPQPTATVYELPQQISKDSEKFGEKQNSEEPPKMDGPEQANLMGEPATPTKGWRNDAQARSHVPQQGRQEKVDRQEDDQQGKGRSQPQLQAPAPHHHHRRTESALFAQLLGTPTPHPRSGASSRPNSTVPETATPKANNSSSLSAMLGMDTPNQAMSILGSNFNFDSPSAFASPRRYNLDTFDISGSPFTAVLGQEPRQSPRSAQLDIQRPMTAFEPQAWEEMHDWIYQ